ncbi:NAD-dependent protein deacetylase sirtuin-3, mitochondrial isoform X1 [Apus apus]|uniref:NAD-dependent protein deacetylase sirtuin-3, mitochondrial isoform X1 n=1 Tax=Apus apus TaxID=8895 RepID=UPI0021F8DD52|nr:NAD-dependent protein deacetylase sirtuin-3, mitochondrial isoform X1 [Apus apus]
MTRNYLRHLQVQLAQSRALGGDRGLQMSLLTRAGLSRGVCTPCSKLLQIQGTERSSYPKSSADRLCEWSAPAQHFPQSLLGFLSLPRRLPGTRPFCFSAAARAVLGRGRRGDGGGEQQLTLQDVAEMIRRKECQRVVVMAGAGISTPSGIPDFRSPGSGLYSNLEQYNIPYPEAIFELTYFFINPKPFFTLAKELYPGNYRPNYAHYFLRLLHDKGLLLRLYTQNIDGLERVAGIPPDKLVEAHGTFATATCTVCRRNFPGEDFRGDVLAEKVPRCPVCTGVVKPDIVFFGEELPQRFLLHLTDFPRADLLFVIGTSLEVEPFASLAGAVRGSVPRVLLNRELVGPFAWHQRHRDVAQIGDVVSGVEKLVELLGWTEEMQTLMQKEKKKLDAKDK